MFKRKVKSIAILVFLIKKHENPSNIIQVKNFIAKLKKFMNNPSTISLGQFKKWLNLHKSIPSDNCKSFLVNYMTNYCNDVHFRFIVSSKTLLKLILIEKLIIHADATYKLLW